MNMHSYSCCDSKSSEAKQIPQLSSLLRIVAEESRLKILCLLRHGEHCVCELIEHLNLSQSLISHHLRDLKGANLVVDRKDGLKVFYSLTNKGQHITNLIFEIPKEEKL